MLNLQTRTATLSPVAPERSQRPGFLFSLHPDDATGGFALLPQQMRQSDYEVEAAMTCVAHAIARLLLQAAQEKAERGPLPHAAAADRPTASEDFYGEVERNSAWGERGGWHRNPGPSTYRDREGEADA